MTSSKCKIVWMVLFMFFKGKKKGNKFNYLTGITLFMFIFVIGFFKLNMVQSSSGVSSSVTTFKNDFYTSNENRYQLNNISDINDNAFIRIYKQDYGFDFVLKIKDREKTFSLKFPWK